MSNEKISSYYEKLASSIKRPNETRNKSPDFTKHDVHLINVIVEKHGLHDKSLLDLGSGTGLLLNKVYKKFSAVTAVEKHKEFSDFIINDPSICIINRDLLEFRAERKYDLITAFGIMNFFSYEQANMIYRMASQALKDNGFIIVKNQMGIKNDVLVDGFSNELDCKYYSLYRTINNETSLLEKNGFRVLEVIRPYPAHFNRWSNTEFIALLCQKKI